MFISIWKAMSGGEYIGGGTNVRLERSSPGIFCTYCLTTYPARWILRVAGGLIFTAKDTFDRLDGFDECLYCGEDMKFVLELKKIGKAAGKRFKIITDEHVISSARAFDEFGDLYYFKNLPHLLLHNKSTFRDREFSRRFWYETRP